MSDALERWGVLVRFVNASDGVGAAGVRDPEFPCILFNAEGYAGTGDCMSDGHYLCVDCSLLSPDADRFHQFGAGGRLDRILLLRRHKEHRAHA